MRIAILGNSGSGKSTLAARLARGHRLARLDLDAIAWEPHKEAVPREPTAASAAVRAFCAAHERWVVEGCYAGLMRVALESTPTLVFLDPGVEACLANCRARPWEPHKYPTKDAQDEKLEFLLSWVRDYEARDGDLGHAAHRALFDAYFGQRHRLFGRVDDALLHRLGLD